jgi:hypothetical protein
VSELGGGLALQNTEALLRLPDGRQAEILIRHFTLNSGNVDGVNGTFTGVGPPP